MNSDAKLNANSPAAPISAVKQEFLRRLEVRGSFKAWCILAGYQPAKHHQVIIKELETLVENLFRALVRGQELETEPLRLMVLTPPGSAKSTYISKLFPPWFLAQMGRLQKLMTDAGKKAEPLGILSCSHSADVACDFGRAARNLIVANERWLGYQLNKDSRAADKWALTNQCYFQAAGVTAGISGKRMHLGVIDDFCGVEADAGSKLFNDQVYVWYENDFVNRLQPISARVIIANHRNEDDLVGRLLKKEAAKWRLIRLRLLIETEEQAESDPLGRAVGEHLWPEYFTREMVMERMSNPRVSGIQQQEPAPEKGNFFQREMFPTYKPSELPPANTLSYYVASDHAVSTRQTADLTCIIPAAFGQDCLWILDDIFWDRADSKRAVAEMLRIGRKYKPVYWWAEKGHITKSIGPFLKDRMADEHLFLNIVDVTPSKDKMTRAQPINGLMATGKVRFPANALWLQRAMKEMMTFPNAQHDDFVDALAWLGYGVHKMFGSRPPTQREAFKANQPFRPTLGWLKESDRAKSRLRIAEQSGY